MRTPYSVPIFLILPCPVSDSRQGDWPRTEACEDLYSKQSKEIPSARKTRAEHSAFRTPELPCFEREGRAGCLAVSQQSSGSQTDFPIASLLHIQFLSWLHRAKALPTSVTLWALCERKQHASSGCPRPRCKQVDPTGSQDGCSSSVARGR